MSVGLDIGTSSIKVCEIVKQGKEYLLKSAGVVGYSGNAIDPNFKDEKEMASMAQIIKKLYQDTKISTKEVVLSVPESQVFTRVMQFPLLNDQEIAQAVKWEAEEYIPIPLSEAVIDHQILERRQNATPPQVLVLLVAVSRNLVERYVQIAEMANLSVIGIETELTALTRVFAPQDKTVLILDLGSHSADIAIASNGNLFFTRSTPTAGEALTRAVAQSLGANAQQAEEYKRTYGFSEQQLEGKVGQALTPIIKVTGQEIKKALHYYQLNLKSDPPTSAIVAGGGAAMPNLAPVLTNILGIEVTIGNPFQNISVQQEAMQSLANYAPLYSIAVGLALREL